MIFQEKYFSCYILLSDQISLSDRLLFVEILINICIALVCEPSCDVTNFEINLIFLIKPFFYITKKSRRKLKYLDKAKRFQKKKKKKFFIIFKGVSVAKNCFRHESVP